jgi:hypothetical protein
VKWHAVPGDEERGRGLCCGFVSESRRVGDWWICEGASYELQFLLGKRVSWWGRRRPSRRLGGHACRWKRWTRWLLSGLVVSMITSEGDALLGRQLRGQHRGHFRGRGCRTEAWRTPVRGSAVQCWDASGLRDHLRHCLPPRWRTRLRDGDKFQHRKVNGGHRDVLSAMMR